MSETRNDRKKKYLLANLLLLALLAVSPVLLATSAAYSNHYSPNSTTTASPALIIQSKIPNVGCGDVHALCPSMLITAYDMASMQGSGITGSGQAVVIVDACGDPNIANDLKTFDSQFGLSNPTLNIYQPQGTPCLDSGWSLETSLDVEWAHVVAPGATINLVEAAQPSDADLFGSWTYALQHSLGNSISNSWIDYGGGTCPSSVVSILSTATKDHVTVLAAAGDSGAWGQGKSTGDSYPVDCQQVLGIGGTTLNVQSTGKYISESAWSGSGGGYVSGAAEPSYQVKANITDSFHDLAKNEVSAVADPNTGVLVYNLGDGGWFQVGGTSVACPLWAAFIADVNQVRTSNALPALGYVNTFLYLKIYGPNGSHTAYKATFHDVTTGNNGWPAGKGWDVPTGLGTFIGAKLVAKLGAAKGA